MLKTVIKTLENNPWNPLVSKFLLPVTQSIRRRTKHIIIIGFFAIFLGLGLTIYKDYGIAWDEGAQRRIGEKVLDYVVKGDPFLLTFSDRYYGSVFETLLMIAEKALKLDNFRSVFLMRHLITFLLFYAGVFFFYLLVKNRFHSLWIGLLGSIFLILSPRIFADSFYNSKDLPFLSMFIIGIYSLIKFLEKRSYSQAVLFGIINAFLIDIRIGGIFLSLLAFIFFIGDLVTAKRSKKHITSIIICFLIYLLSLGFFTVIFWPILWKNPFNNFMNAVIKMGHYSWDLEVLYLGQYLKASNLPWHYIPVWIAITTPIIYSLLFLMGNVILLKPLLKNPLNFYHERKTDLIFLLWFFLPFFSVIILKSVLYDGWRQMFFIYPAFIIVSLHGFTFFWEFRATRLLKKSQKATTVLFILIISGSMINTANFMIRYHPFQNLYFNILGGINMQEVKNKFELDYWGLSYRQGLEYILKNDQDKTIKVCVANYPGKFNANILRPEERKRLIYVDNPKEAKYFLTNFRWHKEEYPYKNRYYSIIINGAEIMTIFEIKAEDGL